MVRPGTGSATPLDYATAGHVEPRVIAAIASWIDSIHALAGQ
jgi:hypothetical protein